MDAVLLPGTAFLEMALHAGRHLGCESVRELVLEAPLVLGAGGALQLQIAVGEPEEAGLRSIEVYSRAAQEVGGEWTRHASGMLCESEEGSADEGSAAEGSAPGDLGSLASAAWPPDGAQPIALDGLYDRMADWGIEYGPVFQGLTAAWRSGEEMYAEVSLPESEHSRAAGFGVHPALLDAALHVLGLGLLDENDEEARPAGQAGENQEAGQVGLPFSWSGASLGVTGAGALRVRVTRVGSGEVSIAACDESGAVVATVASLIVRPVSAEQLAGAGGARRDSLLRLDWVTVQPASPATEGAGEWVVLGSDDGVLAEGLRDMGGSGDAGASVGVFADLASLREALDGGAAVPAQVLMDCGDAEPGEAGEDRDDLAAAAHTTLHRILGVAQEWLADERLEESRLTVLTRGAVAAAPGDHVTGLAQAGVWGMLRSAQTESPGRFVLADVDGEAASWAALPGALGLEEPQLALRAGAVLAPRLARAESEGGALTPPEGESAWRLEVVRRGTIDGLELVPCPEVGEPRAGGETPGAGGAQGAGKPLAAGEVRVQMRAAGLNFRDVLIALGVYPGEATVGGEGAGVVLEVGPDVEGLGVGDRVMGMLPGAFATLAVADERMLAPMPPEWSYAQAAAVPTAFLTAYHGLVDLAGLQAGERVLVHAGAGGVGMAAIALAQNVGAEVFATASPGKWATLEGLGLDEEHIASSRTLDFKQRFLDATGGEGVDVVLNSLAREYVDASLDLLVCGGRFIEMGKTDVRDPETIAAERKGVDYRAFDLLEAGPERIRELLHEVLALFAQGALTPLPLTAWDIRHAPDAFRHVSQARHVGKNVFLLPPALHPAAAS